MLTELVFEFTTPYTRPSFACAWLIKLKYRENKNKSENINSDISGIVQVQDQSHTCGISSLNHEAFNISVEDAAIVEPTGTQSKKVL